MVNQREKCFLFVTALILIVDILMALCIFTILPAYLCVPYHVPYANGDPDEDAVRCNCHLLIMHGNGEATEETANDAHVITVENETTLGPKPTQKPPVKPPEKPPPKPIPNPPGGRKKRNDELTRIQEEFPYLVSMQIPAYNDAEDETIFAGMGTILNEKYFLTAFTNIRESSEWRHVTIRAGSASWFEFGSPHLVRSYFRAPDYDIMLIEVDKPFRMSTMIKPVKYLHGSSWKHAYSIGWPIDMYNENIRNRFKHRPFEVTNWTSLRCVPPVVNYVCFDLDRGQCDSVSGQPLITQCGEFLGLKMTGGSCTEFLNAKKRSLKTFLSGFLNQSRSEEMVVEEKHCREIYRENCAIAGEDVCF